MNNCVRPHGVVFDCDGTLADTEALSFRAWSEVLATRGYTMTDADFLAVIGYPFPNTWEYFRQRAELGDPQQLRKEVRERYLGAFETDLEVHDDAIDTMRALVAEGVPVAVASSSMRASVERVLTQADVLDIVEVIVGADDVAHYKPAPDPYLKAVAQLGLTPNMCSAVEDTSVGVASAVAAGLYTVAVLRAHNTPETLAQAHSTVANLNLDDLNLPVPVTPGA